jgi:hypothetical protein
LIDGYISLSLSQVGPYQDAKDILVAVEKKMVIAFSNSIEPRSCKTVTTAYINRHIIRIASRHPASLGPLSSLAGCQPRALEVAGSNPAGPISILLGYEKKISS